MSLKVGLALGGGGARGFAHLGVAMALRRQGVPIHCVAGTSIGAIVGGVIASGVEDDAMRWVSVSDWKKLPQLFLEVCFPRKGLIRGRKIEQFLRQTIPAGRFSDLKMPFAVVATDYNNGEEVVIRDGDVHAAIRASMSIPGVFNPTVANGQVLVDGGLVNPVPVDVCRSLGADVVIAVDVNAIKSRVVRRGIDDINILGAFDAMFTICTNRLTQMNLVRHPPDLLLRPALRDIMMLDFRDVRELVAQGYEHAMMRREEIRRVVAGREVESGDAGFGTTLSNMDNSFRTIEER